MKVICRKCGKLVDENKAIKLNEVEYMQLTMKAFNFFNEDYSHYTQICVHCYEKTGEKE